MGGDYRSLIVYQKAEKLAELVYLCTKYFPKEEQFGLTSQIRRAVVSVVANIVEGWSRNSYKEKIQFYYISRGSLTEVEFYIDFTYKLKYLNQKQFDELTSLRHETARLLTGLIKSLK